MYEHTPTNIHTDRGKGQTPTVSQMDRVRNEEVHRRAGIDRELSSRAD